MFAESKRISRLFADLYNGVPWLDVNISGTLKTLNAAQAAEKISPLANSIWQIVNHITFWHDIVYRRVTLNEIIPGDAQNGFYEIIDVSEAAWQESLRELDASLRRWLKFLTESDVDFGRIYPPGERDYYYMIQGLLQHDAYHLGQIVLLKKLQGVK